MRVLSAGAVRSGSTWQYNVLRFLLSQNENKEGAVQSAWISEYDPTSSAKHHVVKIHTVADLGGLSADVIFTSYRDVRSVVGSLTRMKWADSGNFNHIRLLIDDYIRNLNLWEEVADYTMRYEDIGRAERTEIARHAEKLEIEPNAATLDRVLAEMRGLKTPEGDSADFRVYDKVTNLHPNHIATEAVSLAALPEDVRIAIECEYGDWLRDRGYL